MDVVLPNDFASAWPLLLPFLALFVQAVINQPSWSAKAKRWVAVGVSVLMGVVYLIATGQISEIPVAAQAVVVRFVVVTVSVLVVAQAVYRFFKPVLEPIEEKTVIEKSSPVGK